MGRKSPYLSGGGYHVPLSPELDELVLLVFDGFFAHHFLDPAALDLRLQLIMSGFRSPVLFDHSLHCLHLCRAERLLLHPGVLHLQPRHLFLREHALPRLSQFFKPATQLPRPLLDCSLVPLQLLLVHLPSPLLQRQLQLLLSNILQLLFPLLMHPFQLGASPFLLFTQSVHLFLQISN